MINTTKRILIAGEMRHAEDFARANNLQRNKWTHIRHSQQLRGLKPGDVKLIFVSAHEDYFDHDFFRIAEKQKLITSDTPDRY